MATATQADIAVSTSWTDIVVVNGALASVNLAIQNKSNAGEIIYVVFGGSSPATLTGGTVLQPGDSVTGNAAAIWVRGPSGGNTDDKIGVTLL